jgi:hypothetical protein
MGAIMGVKSIIAVFGIALLHRRGVCADTGASRWQADFHMISGFAEQFPTTSDAARCAIPRSCK